MGVGFGGWGKCFVFSGKFVLGYGDGGWGGGCGRDPCFGVGWRERVECDGDHDPRCLPFDVFSGDGRELNLVEQRARFNQRYGIGAKRRDDARSTWHLNPRDYHGGEISVVAGHALPVGFHWDVETDAQRDFVTPRYSWRVTGHFNVYPDSIFRRGKGKVHELK